MNNRTGIPGFGSKPFTQSTSMVAISRCQVSFSPILKLCTKAIQRSWVSMLGQCLLCSSWLTALEFIQSRISIIVVKAAFVSWTALIAAERALKPARINSEAAGLSEPVSTAVTAIPKSKSAIVRSSTMASPAARPRTRTASIPHGSLYARVCSMNRSISSSSDAIGSPFSQAARISFQSSGRSSGSNGEISKMISAKSVMANTCLEGCEFRNVASRKDLAQIAGANVCACRKFLLDERGRFLFSKLAH